MEDFANHYGTVVVPARLRKRKFFDLASLNEAIGECIAKHNQTRMQQKPYCREERFLSSEKSTLGELPRERLELKYYAELKVGDNGLI
ncbi:hypothetical protein H8S90_10360 [Olivibacter sp. SDN3]|uniref:hypothetical protein n=1 Tax=Olivibacter sp. SDN3 TaxID=2764720 RepID=UPI0016515564|nr:hypothetical protein [Olivibacter sp. SDN3]QNL51938.1 hypothetical protein H8S90_10360 [Olivibacter sp. SDN3]